MPLEPVAVAQETRDSHSLGFGYLLWVFGFMGAHRFYYGRPWSGTLYFFTLGLAGIGWLIDLALIPALDRSADRRYTPGAHSYTLAWVLLVFLGVFGAHRFYLGKMWTGLLWFLTGGLFLLGWLHDLWTLNAQVEARNRADWAISSLRAL